MVDGARSSIDGASRSAPSDAHPSRPGSRAAKTTSLASAAVGQRVRILGARLHEDDAAWLAAVGLHEGEEVIVLRRAALGGPLHVRTSCGGEFAVARELAASLDVTDASEGEP